MDNARRKIGAQSHNGICVFTWLKDHLLIEVESRVGLGHRSRIGNFLAVWKLQYRCLGLSSCELAACRLVQSRQPATGIIVIDIPAVIDCADTINNRPGLIKFKRYLGQAVEIAVWMGAHHEHNLRFGEPYFSRRFHRKCSLASFSGTSLIQGSHASLSLGSPCGTCSCSPNICSPLPELLMQDERILREICVGRKRPGLVVCDRQRQIQAG